MLVIYDEVHYSLNVEDITVGQAIVILRDTGFTIAEFYDSIYGDSGQDVKSVGLQVLFWLMTKSKFPIYTMEMKLMKFLKALEDAMSREIENRKDVERREHSGMTNDEHYAARAKAMENGEVLDFSEQIAIRKHFHGQGEQAKWFNNWYTQNIMELRAQHAFDFGDIFKMSLIVVDDLRISDFFHYCETIKQHRDAERRQAEKKNNGEQ